MHKNLIASIVLSILMFSSCSEDEFTKDLPITPDSIEIDIDENGITDYSISYSEVLVEGPTISGGIVGVLEPYGENEILKERQGSILFLRNLEEITETVTEPFFWNNTSIASIASLYNHAPTNEWRTQWEVNTDIEYASYFVGLKIINDTATQLAWLEFEIDTSNGHISILNKGVL